MSFVLHSVLPVVKGLIFKLYVSRGEPYPNNGPTCGESNPLRTVNSYENVHEITFHDQLTTTILKRLL